MTEDEPAEESPRSDEPEIVLHVSPEAAERMEALRRKFAHIAPKVNPAVAAVLKANASTSKFSKLGTQLAGSKSALERLGIGPESSPATFDMSNMPDRRTARAAEQTAEFLGLLVKEAEDAEQRENTMLRWTIAGVILAGLAAIASILAIVLTLLQ